MDGNGVHAEIKLRSNFFVRFASDNVLEDFKLASSESGIAFALERLRTLELRVDDGFPGRHIFDGVCQVQIDRILQNVTARACIESLADESVFRVHAEHENGGLGM